MPQTPTSVKTTPSEAALGTASPVSPTKPESVPATETPKNSSRLSQDVFTVPPSNLLDMPAPATPAQDTSEFDSVENDAGLRSPASVSSSNKTPTQASFRKNSWAHEQLPLTPSPRFRNMPLGQGDAKALPEPPNEHEESILEVAPPDLSHVETPPAVPLHTVPMLEQEDVGTPREESSAIPGAEAYNDMPSNPQVLALNTAPVSQVTESQESQASPWRAEDSEGTVRTAESGDPQGLGSDQAPLPLAKDSTPPSIDGSAVSDMSNPVDNSAIQIQQPGGMSANRTPSPLRTPRPFSFIQFGEPPRPSEGLSYGASYEDEISSQQRQAVLPSPMSPISPRQASFHEPTQPLDAAPNSSSADHEPLPAPGESQLDDQVVPIHHDTNHDFGPQDQSFTKKPRPRSFSRPFQDQFSRVRQERQMDPEVEKRLSAEIARPFYTMPSPTNIAQSSDGQGPEPQTKAQRPSIADVDPNQKRSRTSGIFKNFSISPRDQSQAENPSTTPKSVDTTTPTPLSVEKRSRRGKLFRTLTGRSGESNNSRDEVPALPKSRTDLGQDGFSSRRNGQSGDAKIPQENGPNPNRGGKLQRASTSGIAGESGGKKRRFSGFVSVSDDPS